MIQRGGKEGRRPVAAFPVRVWCVAPSNIRRNCLGTRNLLNQGCWFIAAFMLATVAAQAMDIGGAATVAEAVSTIDEVVHSHPVLRQGTRTRVSAWDAHQRRLQALESPDDCLDSPLWEKKVDPSNYIFGCKEIEEMLHGSKRLIGNGLIRDVYLAEYKDNVVVLKILQDKEDPKRKRTFVNLHKREALVLNEMRGHPNIVQMLGFCNTTLVSEYHGTSLDGVMWRNTFSIDRVVSMALDAAKALQALHEGSIAPIVHFDIKPQQLLLGEDGRLMLNDFNMAQLLRTRGNGVYCSFGTKRGCRAVAWRAPENIASKPLTEKVDIYSMGMIFFSLISGVQPYPQGERGSIMILNGERPAIDPSWHLGYMQVVQGMWQEEPTDRPSARQVVARLEVVLDSLSSYPIDKTDNEGTPTGLPQRVEHPSNSDMPDSDPETKDPETCHDHSKIDHTICGAVPGNISEGVRP